MKWRKWFIEPAGNGTYRCTSALHNHSKTFFIRQLSQGIDFPEPPSRSHAVNVEQPLTAFDTTGYLIIIAVLIIIAAFYKISYRWRYELNLWYWKQWWSMWWPLAL
ncbi:hypothetical protein [Dictyobacter kobayashii]|nr:hypothetical protein [Dictyobacter kobayashii]